jgi:hypothetical protein
MITSKTKVDRNSLSMSLWSISEVRQVEGNEMLYLYANYSANKLAQVCLSRQVVDIFKRELTIHLVQEENE